MSSIYIHFPFCIHKCSYCDFYSIENLKGIDPFVNSLVKEIELRGSMQDRKPTINTLFLGGGTPSLISPDNMQKIMLAVNEYFEIADDAEITLECNPGAADRQYFEEYRQIGFNRMSIGVQSFNESELNFLERIHSPRDADKAFSLARDCGFDNISIDLMFAIPRQTRESWLNTLTRAASLAPEHISAYSLIYEPNTPLYKRLQDGKFKPLDEDIDISLYEMTAEVLGEIGLEQYEVSNYAKKGKKCRHNLNYWDTGTYHAFGPSAHGYDGNVRYWNFRSNMKYKRLISEGKLPIEGQETLSRQQRTLEAIYLGLRAEGLDIAKFQRDYGINIAQSCQRSIDDLSRHGYWSLDAGILRLTNIGYFNNDSLTVSIYNQIESLIIE